VCLLGGFLVSLLHGLTYFYIVSGWGLLSEDAKLTTLNLQQVPIYMDLPYFTVSRVLNLQSTVHGERT